MTFCDSLSSVQSRVTLSDGHTMPCVGFGTWMIKDDLNGAEPILEAIRAGYRHIDTASLYNSERSVGEAVRLSALPREEFFITTKVWKDDLDGEKIRISLEKSLSRLGMDYVDLFLIHWPRADYDDLNWAARLNAAWYEMIKLREEGLTRSIGVANCLPHHLQALPDEEKPVVDQFEFHPGYTQQDTVEYCQARGIQVQAWAPLGRGLCLENAVIREIAREAGVSPAQVCIRFALQKGAVPLVKSAHPQRMRDNAAVFSFTLSKEQMERLENLPYKSGWSGEHPDTAIPLCPPEKHYL